MRLIPNWKKAWGMISVQSMTIAAAMQGAWVAVPPKLIEDVPWWAIHAFTIGLLVFGVIGRMVDQPKVDNGRSKREEP